MGEQPRDNTPTQLTCATRPVCFFCVTKDPVSIKVQSLICTQNHNILITKHVICLTV